MPAPNERLDEAMRARRLQLGIRTWRDLALRAGISYETLRAIRAGEGRPTGATIHGLNQALGWKDGAGVEALLAGAEPTPVEQPPALPTLEEIAERQRALEEREAERATEIAGLKEELRQLRGDERNSKAG